MIQYSLFHTAGCQPKPELTRSPITLFRWGYGTLVLLRRSMMPSGVIGFASDIVQDVFPIAGLCPDGLAAYDSGSFGWLRGPRKARLYRLAPWSQHELSANIADLFRKAPYTWPDEGEFQRLPLLMGLCPDDCLFYENGEKEYSAEITEVFDNTAELLLRYTVGGSNAGNGIESVQNFRRLLSTD